MSKKAVRKLAAQMRRTNLGNVRKPSQPKDKKMHEEPKRHQAHRPAKTAEAGHLGENKLSKRAFG